MDWAELERSKLKARQDFLKLDRQIAQTKIRKMIRPQLWIQRKSEEWNELPLTGTIKEAMSQKTPQELVEIFAKLQQQNLDIVLVGGQAVNFWAERYRQRSPELEQFLPYASEDIDLLGGKIEAQIAKEVLGGMLVLNENFSPSPNSGILTTKLGNRELRIDFLNTVYGLDEEEIVRSALTYEGTGQLSTVQIQVQNPILCLEGKLKSVIGLPQFGRQDLKHLKMSLLFSKEYLQDICLSSPARAGLKLIERIYNRAKRDVGLEVWLQYEIAIESAIPLKTIELLEEEEWSKFRSIRLPQIEQELTDKRTKYQTLVRKKP